MHLPNTTIATSASSYHQLILATTRMSSPCSSILGRSLCNHNGHATYNVWKRMTTLFDLIALRIVCKHRTSLGIVTQARIYRFLACSNPVRINPETQHVVWAEVVTSNDTTSDAVGTGLRTASLDLLCRHLCLGKDADRDAGILTFACRPSACVDDDVGGVAEVMKTEWCSERGRGKHKDYKDGFHG